MGKNLTIANGFTGLNTVLDPIRLPYDEDTGISDLAVAVDIVLDETGAASRRQGFTEANAVVDSHSLFCNKGRCVLVADSALYEVMPTDYSLRLITSLSNDNRLASCQVNESIYYVNETDLGYIDSAGVNQPWETHDYVGPITDRHFDIPRTGRHICFFAGCIFVSDGPNLFWSEPYGFGLYDRARNYIPFHTNIKMIKPVETGIYVSDETHTYFLEGTDPAEFKFHTKSSFPALEWSEAIDLVDPMEVGLQDLAKSLSALWVSTKGACLGTPQGDVINLNRNKVIYPEGISHGASILRGYNFIHTMR